MTIGNRVKELRTYEGITQAKLARIIGVKPKTVSAYENNSSFPSLNVVVKAATHFNVSVDYILCRTNNPKSHEMKLPENMMMLHPNTPDEMVAEIRNQIDLLALKYKL